MLRDSLPKAYIELEWDADTRLRVPAGRSDIDRVRRDGPAFAERCNATEGLSPADEDALVREALEFFCGEKVGKELYDMSLEYVGGGMPGEECVDQMVAVVEAVAEAWMRHIEAEDERRRKIGAEYLGGDDAI